MITSYRAARPQFNYINRYERTARYNPPGMCVGVCAYVCVYARVYLRVYLCVCARVCAYSTNACIRDTFRQ